MKKYSNVLLVVVLLLSFAVASFAADAPKAAEPPKPKALKVGDMITEFSLPDGLGKGTVSFEKDIKGKSKVIILSFMTTSCSACKAELNVLNDLVGKFGDDVKVYAISVDLNGEKSIPAYDKSYGLNVRYMLDPDFKVPQMFGFTYTPSVVVANKDGKILFMKGGYSPAADSEIIINAVKDALK